MLSDALCIVMFVVFMLSLYYVLDLDPVHWIPIVGLCVSTAYFLPFYAHLLERR